MKRIINMIESGSSFYPCEIEEWCKFQMKEKPHNAERIIDFWFKYFVNTPGPNPECKYFVKKSNTGELYLSKDRFGESEKKQYVIQAISYNSDGNINKKAVVELLTSEEVNIIAGVLGAVVCDYSIAELRR